MARVGDCPLDHEILGLVADHYLIGHTGLTRRRRVSEWKVRRTTTPGQR